jgi:signal transduction histidine kinase/streptogramin lyase
MIKRDRMRAPLGNPVGLIGRKQCFSPVYRCLSRSLLALALWFNLNGPGAHASLTNEYSLNVWQPKDGLPDPRILGLAQTPDGYLWVATAAGLSRFDGARFEPYKLEGSEGTNQAAIKAIQCDAQGALWIITSDGRVLRGIAGRFASPSAEQGNPRAGAHGVYVDAHGQIIVSDREGRVFRAVGERLESWLDTRAAAAGPFAGINVETTGIVWVRHGYFLSWWDGNAWQRLTSPTGEGNFEALKTGASPGGGMWISSRTGLRKFRNGRWEERQFTYARPVKSVQAVFEDSRGDLWVTLGFGGLMRFDPEGYLESIGVGEGLSHDSVRHIFEDAEGNLWLGTEAGGLTVLSPRDSKRVSASGSGAPRLPWSSPRVILEELRSDAHPVWERFSSTGLPSLHAATNLNRMQLILPSRTAVVEARYTGLSFSTRGRLRFACRLQGLDRDWVDVGTNRRVSYTNLPPGPYELEVRAASASGLWSEPCPALGFVVQPRLWQRWTFRVLLGGALALGLLAWHRAHVLQLQRRHALEQSFSHRLIESQEAERQRIAAELHDSVGQKLLIIKNSAQLGLRDTGSSLEISEQLEAVSRTASECLDEIRQIARNLRPYQLDQMGLTKAIRSLAGQVEQSSGLKLRLDMDEIDGLFPPAAEINVYRVVQEALSNILRHAQATEALLRIERLGREVEIVVSDNGRGFAPRSANDAASPEGGFGLTNLRQRVQILGGRLELQSAPGAGAKLHLRLPINPVNHEG